MKKLYYILFLVCLTFITDLNSQTQQANLNRTKHWRFGHKAGLDFNMTTGVPAVFNGSDGVVYEGNSCISDTLGNLLFYCTGDTVWNKNHQMMMNGDAMPSDKVTILNSCIIPRPGNGNQYFIFVNECINNNCNGGKLYYSLVDMTLDGGNGGVVAGQKNIVVMLQAYAGMSFTKHSNGVDYWLSYYEAVNPYNFCMIKITNSGPDTTNRVISAYAGGGGMSRFSPDGTKLASDYHIYAFNNATAALTNSIQLPTDSLGNYYNSYSFEFSPDSKKLYYGLYNGGFYNCLFQQFDLSVYNQTAIAGSVYNFYDSYSYYSFRGVGHLQLGPNGKIYVARTGSYSDSLHVIHNPNGSGAACNFQFNTLALGTPCNFSLPIYPNYYFKNIPLLTSVNENQNFNSLKINFYPNPCNEILKIEHLILNNYNYSLYNSLGQLVLTVSTNQLFCNINTSLLPNGMYSLVVLSSFGSQSKKIIINH